MTEQETNPPVACQAQRRQRRRNCTALAVKKWESTGSVFIALNAFALLFRPTFVRDDDCRFLLLFSFSRMTVPRR